MHSGIQWLHVGSFSHENGLQIGHFYGTGGISFYTGIPQPYPTIQVVSPEGKTI